MRAILLWLIVPLNVMPLMGADLKIDHVTLAGSHLDEMRRAFQAATGIAAEYGGAHANHATEMAVASFADGSYFELMGIQAKADPAAVAAHVWGKFLKENAGPCAFALRVPDVSAEIAQLAAAGVKVGAAERSGRTRPDGVTLAWETADIGDGPRGSFFPFLIRDFTPRANRVYPSGKPTTEEFSGIGLVVIGVRDLKDATERYRKTFGLAAPVRQRDEKFGADLAWFEGTPIALAAAYAPGSWLAQRVAAFGDAPCAFVLAAKERLPEAAAQWFGHALAWFRDGGMHWRIGVWR